MTEQDYYCPQGFVQADKPVNPKFKDLTGQTFNRLTVLRYAGYVKAKGIARHYFECLCNCGKHQLVQGAKLLKGWTQSCGCLQAQRTSQARLRHGHTKNGQLTRAFRCWRAMVKRVRDVTNPRQSDYIGRGIGMCARWQEFERFLEDMGEPPSEDYSIDRIDNEGGYWCGHCEECISVSRVLNCRWADRNTQCRNKRNNIKVTYKGREICLAEAVEMSAVGVSYSLALKRHRKGWSIESVVETPPGRLVRALNGQYKTER